MELISLCPLRAASLLWSSSGGAWTLTIVCKATFSLAPAISTLHQEQEPPNEEDSYWDDDPSRSLSSPNDLVPFKARADILLVGKAFAPGRRQVRSLVARMVVGAVDKSIEVFGKRVWTKDGQLLERPLSEWISLAYERAGGGPGTWNPVGMRSDAAPDVHGQIALPNLQLPGFKLGKRGEPMAPAGFGPIAPEWPQRVERLGRRRAPFRASSLQRQVVPNDVDPAYFNAAPRDQQVDALHGDEQIILENLHAEHARLVTKLPGIKPRVFAVHKGAMGQDISMRCDTLWIDTDRGICTLVWRGHIPMAEEKQAGRVLVAMEEPGLEITWADVLRMYGGRMDASAGAGQDGGFDIRKTVRMAPDAARTKLPSESMGKATLPFTKAGDLEPEKNERRAHPSYSDFDAALPFGRMGSSPSLVVDALKPAVETQEIPAPSPWAGGMPLSPVPLAEEVAKPLAEVVTPPLISSGGEGVNAPPALGPGVKRGARAGAWRPPGRGGEGELPGSALSASNAAAAVSERATSAQPVPMPAPLRAAARSSGAEVIELLWFEAEKVAQIRKQAAWKKIISELKAKPRDEEVGDSEPREKRQEAKDRRDVLAVLRHGEPMGTVGLGEELEAAVEDGIFRPPLALVDGVLEFPFDEKETLKATMALVAPFTGGDKKLKEQSDTIGELLKSPWLEKGSAGLEGHTLRLREAFGQCARGMPSGYLEAHTQRLLLEQRHYQKRTLLGQEWIRGILVLGGVSIPAYLPEKLGKELPMYQRFRVKMVVELRLQVDQFEAHPMALRVVAVGRVVGG